MDGETKASNRQVRFRNTSGLFIWLCIAFPTTANCGGSLGGHLTRGWWGIGLNQEVHVLTTQESWVYFMAEADDGAGWNMSQVAVQTHVVASESSHGSGVS
ncbi:hypothetical protein HUA76_37005 [Myxococcus sp. CA056]|uniref:hypothetical protein n=1 Tax=Myxococcus sp. CA056 TaxID=2741740 RepID=UPI00157A336B|nr:hypothetical protein [Myxococcus sp. CA056]NTX16384.1 hypothetical protein [Myxococcus sp. CA056]